MKHLKHIATGCAASGSRRAAVWFRWAALGCVALVAVAILVAFGRQGNGSKSDKAAAAAEGSQLFWKAQRGPMTISLLVPGTTQAKESKSIECQVQGDAKIIWLIEEGKQVKKGDKLVELEVSGLDEQLTDRRVQVSEAQARYDEAVENVEIQKSQNNSDLLSAENKLFLAQMDQKKYEEGDFPQNRMEKESSIKVAEAELERARDRLKWTKKLVGEGYVSGGEQTADELSLTKQELEVEKARNSLKVLVDYEYHREVRNLENSVREAQDELERIKRKNVSELRNKQTAMDSAKARLDLEKMRLSQLEDQAANTLITAPEDGMVVYVKPGGRWDNTPLQEGSQVHFRQKLIDLPNFSQWEVETRVHESMIQQVKMGQGALVSIDAMPGKVLEASVSKIGVLPDSTRWFQPDTKEYIVNLDLTTTTLQLKPGMSTKNEILLKDLGDVLYVPVQAVMSRDGKYLVKVRKAGVITEREVKIGQNNDRHVQITEGLEEGEQVALMAGKSAIPTNIVVRPSERQRQEGEKGSGDKAKEETGEQAPAAGAPEKQSSHAPKAKPAATKES